MKDDIVNKYASMLIESRVNYSPERSSYNGPLGGELINSPALTVDDHLKAIAWHQDAVDAIKNGTHKWSFPPTPVDKEIAVRQHNAYISVHKDQIEKMGSVGDSAKD